jgi:hypothetical protein
MKPTHIVVLFIVCCSLRSNGLVISGQDRPQKIVLGANGSEAPDNSITLGQHDVNSKDFNAPMRATPHGICMYALPPHFNIGLLDSTFKQPVPQPMNISPPGEPPLQGMFDTNQFALERIFYDRMEMAATRLILPSECVMFYVPYFVAWETSAANGVWVAAHRPALDKELVGHLTHFGSIGLSGRNHFIVVGRISYNALGFVNNGIFQHMVKLVLEDTDPGQMPNVFAVPYPTWFRYYPSLETSPGRLPTPGKIHVHSAFANIKSNSNTCINNGLGNLTLRMRSACDGRSSCSFLISLVAETVSQQTSCPIHDVVGSYSCDKGTPMSFRTVPHEKSVGHAVVLSCHRGPCWLWGACTHPGKENPGSGNTRAGPMAALIGSARAEEYERNVIFDMCAQRPHLCSVYDTGLRENSSTFVHSRIPDMYQLLMASTFCINPPGDTPTRKGLFDSLVLGCIPVVTSEDSMQHYRFHLPFWRSVSVLVTTEQLFSEGFNLFDHLAAYQQNNAMEVWQKQETIRKVAYSLQYSNEPATAVMRGPDAFDRIVEYMLSRPTYGDSQHDFPDTYQFVSEKSGRKLFARSGDYQDGFGASSIGIEKASDDIWRILGRGDGSCCYRIVNVASNRTLYAQTNAPDAVNFGAAKAFSPTWSDQKWRFTAQGDGSFTIANVASGRRLFAMPGQEALAGMGATLLLPGSPLQRWKIVAKKGGEA